MISILIGIILLYFGAESLVRGSSKLASRFGIPPLVIGLTIVAFGTSSPELLVSLSAAFNGSSDVAIGNVVGSNIFNIALILGVTALICPPAVHLDLIRREIPIMIGISLVGLYLIHLGEVTRIAGILLFLGLVIYIVASIRGAKLAPAEDAGCMGPDVGKPMPVWLCALLIVAGLGVLVLGSHLFVTGAVATAVQLGVSEAIIGLTIVSAGTSLPELATSVVAAIKKESDVAIGNIIGSNIFNILGILGLSAAVLPMKVVGITMRDGYFMMGTAVILLPFAFTQKSISRSEGCVLLATYAAYLYLLWPR